MPVNYKLTSYLIRKNNELTFDCKYCTRMKNTFLISQSLRKYEKLLLIFIFQFLLHGEKLCFSVTASKKVSFTPKLEIEKGKRINIT